MKCITATTLTTFVNGKPKVAFHLDRGIRQDDPISRYIFIICVEHLGLYIHCMSTREESRIRIKITKDGIDIPYLCLQLTV